MRGLISFFLRLIREDGRRRQPVAVMEYAGAVAADSDTMALDKVTMPLYAALDVASAPRHGHRAAAPGDHAPTMAGPGAPPAHEEEIPGSVLAAPMRIPSPPPADEPGFFIFVPFPSGAGGTTQAAGPTPVAQPGDEDAGPSRSATEPPHAPTSVLDEAQPSPRTVARPCLQDSTSMEGRRRLFGRAIAAIDRRLSRHSGLASAAVYISSEDEGGTPASPL
ncbi:hypothetical protein VPH35_124637 [Triticum aestivum]